MPRIVEHNILDRLPGVRHVQDLTCWMRWRLGAWRTLRLVPWKCETPSCVALQIWNPLPDVEAVTARRCGRISAAIVQLLQMLR
jgi:hypothetical protein